jgi:hypothetical protein
MSKKRWYQAEYNGKEYNVLASCEEEAYWEVLKKNGIFYSPSMVDKITKTENMRIILK